MVNNCSRFGVDCFCAYYCLKVYQSLWNVVSNKRAICAFFVAWQDEKRMYKHEIHIGLLIKDELYRQRRSVAWLAAELYTDRSNMYKILRRSNIDSALLMRISRALQHNFFDDIAQLA